MPLAPTDAAGRPKSVGIRAMEVYFPMCCVDQVELEKFDNVSKGKYTIGLGQSTMSFCDDREDIHSIAMTVVQQLLEKYSIPLDQIGRIDVGTETIIDKAKSVKSALMMLFENHTDIEGLDTTNACFGGTQALFNAVSWVESSAWDGRYALVVAADIAVYASGPARPTGSCGAVAMLIGPDAPLVLEGSLRGVYSSHTWDFFKPHLDSEYPEVDGQLSVQCYMKAFDECYKRYLNRFAKETGDESTDLSLFDHVLFHSPYTKLVQKAFGRLVFLDYLKDPANEHYSGFSAYKNVDPSTTYADKELERLAVNVSNPWFELKTSPSLLAARALGNTYTASLYFSLASILSLIANENVSGRRIGLFSYGSGCAATFFSIRVEKDVKNIRDTLNLQERLNNRRVVSPKEFTEALRYREAANHWPKDTPAYQPKGEALLGPLLKGTYYVTHIDEKRRRYYARAT